MVYAKVREIQEMVHEKQPNTKSGIRIPKMVYAKAEEIPENGTYVLWNKN